MVSADQYGVVTELVDDALAAGAERVAGGPREVPGLSGKFIAPTVLAGVEDEMRIMREEIFGPVVPIIVVDSEEEALQRANDSNFGLGASVWTKDRAKGERMARRIESGMVWINDHSYTHAACQCSWGGVKESGLGRSHSKFGFYECVDIKLVSWEPGLTRDFWWQPYDRTLGRGGASLGEAPLRPQRPAPEGAPRGRRCPSRRSAPAPFARNLGPSGSGARTPSSPAERSALLPVDAQVSPCKL